MKSRDEILQLAQECQRDERVKRQRSSAGRVAMGWGMWWALVLVAIKVAHAAAWSDSVALVSLTAASFDLSLYGRLRQRRQLVYGLIWLAVGVANLWHYVATLGG